MRVLVATTAGAGHFGPLVPVARACVAAGHEVRVAAPASFADAVGRAGFDHVPLADPAPEELDAVFSRVPGLSLEESNRAVVREVFAGADARAAQPAMEAVVADWQPDVVLRETTEFSSYVVAEATSTPHVQVSIGTAAMDTAVVSLLGDALDRLGAPRGTAGLAGAPVIRSVPPSLDGPGAPTRVHRVRHEAADGGGRLPGGAAGDRPLVYVSFGTVAGAMGLYPDLYRAVIEALSGLPVRLLVTIGEASDPSLLGPVPSNVHVEPFWPQADAMPEASAVVGHGGFGTTMQALVAGVPVVSLPLFALDQHLNAAAVAEAGAGLTVEGGPEGVGVLADTLGRVLADDRYRAAARRLADENAKLPPVGVAVEFLETIADAGRPV